MPSIPLESAIVLLAFLAGFASVMVTVLPLMRGNPRAARLRAVAQRREELSRQQREELAQQRARQKPQASANMMRAVIDRLRLQNLLASPELRQKLSMAGWRRPSALVAFVFARLPGRSGKPR
jgi:tight adherence protein C